MSTPNNGGSAFPVPPARLNNHNGDAHWDYAESGMTLRDYFAANALQGLCANSGGPIQANGMHGWGFCNCRLEDVAITAYGLADAMLAAREKGAQS